MAPAKHGLGRGLEALIRPSSEGLSAGVRQVEISRISPNPQQPRHKLDQKALQELAASIKEHGVIQPLVVTPALDSKNLPHYHLIAGERRWSAAKLAGLERVPVIVRGATPQEMLQLALVENLQRQDLNPLEEASAYRSLIDEFGMTQEQVAAQVSKDRTTVSNALRLLKLPEEIQRAVIDKTISEGHARALLAVADEHQQTALLHSVIANGLSVRQTEEAARRLNERGREHPPAATTRTTLTRPEPAVPAETRALEDELRQALGTRVQVFRSREGGKIVVHFFSEEELESIYNKIVGK